MTCMNLEYFEFTGSTMFAKKKNNVQIKKINWEYNLWSLELYNGQSPVHCTKLEVRKTSIL